MSKEQPTKKELRDILDERGVKYEETDTNAALQKLIDDNPVEVAEESDIEEEEDLGEDESEEEIEDVEEVEEKETYGPTSKKNSLNYNGKGDVDIVNGERYIRTFSKDVHGEDFAKLAKVFINKNSNKEGESPFKMVNSDLIKNLSVTYEKIGKDGKVSRVTDSFGASIAEKNRALIVASANCVDVKIV
jgi:hypothetical protein